MNFFRNLLIRISGFTNQNVALYGGILTVAYVLLFGYGADEQDRKIAEVDVQMTQEAARGKDSDKALAKLDTMKAEFGALSSQFKEAAHKLPSEIPMSEILKSIDTLATSAGVKIRATDPGKAIKEEIVELIPVHIRGQGSYSEITMFFYYMGSMERIAKVSNFTISAPGEGEPQGRAGTLNFEGDVVSYRYMGDDKPAEGKK